MIGREAICLILSSQVQFVTSQEERKIRRSKRSRIVQESWKSVEGSVRCQIVDEDCTRSAPIIRPRNRTETFSTCSIPELQFYSFSSSAIADFDDFGCKFNADCLT